jgi:kinesin family protein 4/21/27
MEQGHSEELAKLKAEHDATLQAALAKAEEESAALVQNHVQETMLLKSQHQETITEVNSSLVGLHAQHREALEATKARHEKSLAEQRARLTATLDDLKLQHSKELETLHKDRDLLAQELESHRTAADEFTIIREQTRQAHEQAIGEKTTRILGMEQQLSTVGAERDDFEAEVALLRGELDKTRSAHSTAGAQRDGFEAEVAKLRAELNRTRSEQSKLIQEASKRESLVGELERHRSVLADMQENLQRVKDEKDTLQTEKNRSDALVRELQAQVLARSSSPPNGRPGPDRNLAYTRATGLPAMKLPPPTPPPSVPPPPAPRANGDASLSTSSHASSALASSSSRDSQPDSPSTSVGASVSGFPVTDSKTTARLEQQAKQLDEQEAMIKTLNKQLTHCESDLQTHMDLVSTLETSLGDSEKNRKFLRRFLSPDN